jgi:hypothetical protein
VIEGGRQSGECRGHFLDSDRNIGDGRGDAALPSPITMDVVFRENLLYAG